MVNLIVQKQYGCSFFPQEIFFPIKMIDKKIVLIAGLALFLLVASIFAIKKFCTAQKKVTFSPNNLSNTSIEIPKENPDKLKDVDSKNKDEFDILLTELPAPFQEPILSPSSPLPNLTDSNVLDVKNGILDVDENLGANATHTLKVLNETPHQSFTDLKMTTFNEILEFVTLHGPQLESLNLETFDCSNDEFGQLIDLCPQLKSLSISSKKITNSALKSLEGKTLTHIIFKDCVRLSNKALLSLKGMSTLTNINLSGCINLRDRALKHLIGLQLIELNLSQCDKLTPLALEHLRDMPPQLVLHLDGCSKIPSDAIDQFKNRFTTLSTDNPLLNTTLTDKKTKEEIKKDQNPLLKDNITSSSTLPSLPTPIKEEPISNPPKKEEELPKTEEIKWNWWNYVFIG